jgi:feruloyl esterase
MGMDGDQGLAAIKNLHISNGSVVVAQREVVDSPYTVVKLVLHPAPGSNINVEIRLPDESRWNGRFLGLGNGGSAGNIDPQIFREPLLAGYAVACTDLGTANPGGAAQVGAGNPEVWKDFGFRATHLMTVYARQVIEAFYGRAPVFSYFWGQSTGGQQALQEAQRYPEDYDGIVAGIPAHCRAPLHAYFLWNEQIVSRCPFTKSQQQSIVNAGLEYMARRESPSLAGRVISDPRHTKEDAEAVIRLAMQKDPTLTAAHAEALRLLFDGPRHVVNGTHIFNGIPFGSSIDGALGNLYLFHWVFGMNKNVLDINFGADIDRYLAALGPMLNAENPDLTAFDRRGGKLLMYSGTVDSCVPWHATLDYYGRVTAVFGDLEKVRSFFRYYLIPGYAHGPGPVINKLPDMLALMVDWREHGVVPKTLHCQRVTDGKVELDIPIDPVGKQCLENN